MSNKYESTSSKLINRSNMSTKYQTTSNKLIIIIEIILTKHNNQGNLSNTILGKHVIS